MPKSLLRSFCYSTGNCAHVQYLRYVIYWLVFLQHILLFFMHMAKLSPPVPQSNVFWFKPLQIERTLCSSCCCEPWWKFLTENGGYGTRVVVYLEPVLLGTWRVCVVNFGQSCCLTERRIMWQTNFLAPTVTRFSVTLLVSHSHMLISLCKVWFVSVM